MQSFFYFITFKLLPIIAGLLSEVSSAARDPYGYDQRLRNTNTDFDEFCSGYNGPSLRFGISTKSAILPMVPRGGGFY